MNTGNNPLKTQVLPDKIAHYRIINKLGQGGMSIVYKALDERLNRAVALKILHPFLAGSLEYRKRFFREAEAVARLTHPNIVQIYDVGETSDPNKMLYIVTELIQGQTLLNFAKSTPLLELPELSAMIIWEIAHALDHAHQKGIIHRDIKPDNIMITNEGQVKLMDFGIASIGNDESVTQSNTLLGSLAHIAPEVIEGQKASAASDIYSLSTVFYWMLTNELPFQKNSPHALLKAIISDTPEKLQVLSPYILDELASVVEKGMKKDPSKRFLTVLHMAEAIERALWFMGISIDSKKVSQVLKNPISLSDFKTSLDRQIKKQRDIYYQEKNELAAMALSCRLTKSVDEKKKISFKKLAQAVVLIFPITLVLFWWWPKNEVIHDTKIEAEISQDLKIYEDRDYSASEMVLSEPPKPPNVTVPNNVQELKAQEILLVILPFADVFLNKKLIAQSKKVVTLKLEKGTHKLLFTHPYAASIEQTIEINEFKPKFELQVELRKTKPAFLEVNSNISADVAVDGKFKGSSDETIKKPILIPFPDRSHSQIKEVIVSRPGYIPHIVEVKFIAGQTQRLNVTLKPSESLSSE